MIIKIILISITISFSSVIRAESQAIDFDSDLNNDNIPVVLTASRIKQPQSEAPASITVIDKEMLQGLGIHKLVEIFRLVPGMQVGYVSGNTPSIGYHGLTDDNSRRLQVLIDGRSVYKPALSRILWDDLPISINHIAKIEVVRGPNTASYGANSYLAVINIITEHPNDQLGWSFNATEGQRGVKDYEVNFADMTSNFEYRVSLLHQADKGFDLSKDQITPRYDAASGNSILFDAIRHQGNANYRIKVGFKNNNRQLAPTFAEITPFHGLNNQQSYLQFNFQQAISPQRERKIQAYINNSDISEEWDVCLPRLFISNELFDLYSLDSHYTESFLAAISAGMAPPQPTSPEIAAQAAQVFNRFLTDGSINTCGSANQNLTEQRIDFEWQESFNFNKKMRLVTGFNVRNDNAKAESFLSKKESKNSGRLFTHFEWKSTPSSIINIGGNLGYDGDSGTEFSPRFALIHHFGKKHTLRAITAFATRTPDIFEESGFRTYTLRNLNPTLSVNENAFFYQHSQSKGGLRSEKIRSYELGYYGQFFNSKLLVDAKVFEDSLYDILVGNSKLTDFNIQNSGSIKLHGFESQLDYHFNSQLRFWASYSHVGNNQPTSNINLRSIIKNSGSFGLFFKEPSGWHFSGFFYANSRWFGQDFYRFDTTAAYQYKFHNRWSLLSKITLRHRFDNNFLFDSNNYFKDKNTLFIQFSLSQFE